MGLQRSMRSVKVGESKFWLVDMKSEDAKRFFGYSDPHNCLHSFDITGGAERMDDHRVDLNCTCVPVVKHVKQVYWDIMDEAEDRLIVFHRSEIPADDDPIRVGGW